MRLITRRDVVVALVAVSGTLAVVSAAQKPPEIMHSRVFDWNAMTAKANDYGSSRAVVRAPTPTLEELEMHITTLNPGQTSHAPHQHANEELIIIREGTVETLSLGEWKRVGAGSIIFNASNELHGIRNVGSTPATYHVINWKSPSTDRK
jgi:XRE family transcriptional regulator, regulator of sulfur utilization